MTGPTTTVTRILVMEGHSPRLAEVIPIIERHRVLLPTWCHELLLREGTQTDCPLSIVQSLRYHFATLSVHGSWWTHAADTQEEAVRHELTHLLLAPLDDFGRTLFDEFVVEHGKLPEQLVKWTRERYVDAMEQTVVDLTRAMGQLDNPRLTRTLPPVWTTDASTIGVRHT